MPPIMVLAILAAAVSLYFLLHGSSVPPKVTESALK